MTTEQPKDECYCSKDQDGRCVSCSERMSGIVFDLIETLMFKLPALTKALCRPCKKRDADWACAKAIRDIVSAHPEFTDVSAVVAFTNNFVASSGITKTPLLDAEIRRMSGRSTNEPRGEATS